MAPALGVISAALPPQRTCVARGQGGQGTGPLAGVGGARVQTPRTTAQVTRRPESIRPPAQLPRRGSVQRIKSRVASS